MKKCGTIVWMYHIFVLYLQNEYLFRTNYRGQQVYKSLHFSFYAS